MKKMIALGLLALSTMASTTVFAEAPNVSYSMPAVEVGFKWNSADYDSAILPGTTSKQEIGFQLGTSTVFNFASSFGLKTGLFYSERPLTYETNFLDVTTTTKAKITYFEVPALFMFKFEDYAGVYVGPSIAVRLGNDNVTDPKSMIIPITLGAQFKFLPNFGLNIFFETVPGELAKGIKSSRAVGANLMFTFD